MCSLHFLLDFSAHLRQYDRPTEEILAAERQKKCEEASTHRDGMKGTALHPKRFCSFQAITFFSVSIFAYLGVLARTLLSELAKLNPATLYARIGATFFLPNVVGTLMMGIVAGALSGKIISTKPVSINWRANLNQQLNPRTFPSVKTIHEQNSFQSWQPFLVGITTGFCGSCTTFATWHADAVKQYLQVSYHYNFSFNSHSFQSPQKGAYIVFDSILTTLLTFSGSYYAFLFGRHIS